MSTIIGAHPPPLRQRWRVGVPRLKGVRTLHDKGTECGLYLWKRYYKHKFKMTSRRNLLFHCQALLCKHKLRLMATEDPIPGLSPGMLTLLLPLHTASFFPWAAKRYHRLSHNNASSAVLSQFPFLPLKTNCSLPLNYYLAYCSFRHVHLTLLLPWGSPLSLDFCLSRPFLFSLSYFAEASHTMLGKSNLTEGPRVAWSAVVIRVGSWLNLGLVMGVSSGPGLSAGPEEPNEREDSIQFC